MIIEAIARIESDFESKFAIPRQSGLVSELESRIIFEPEYRNPDAVRGLSAFSHIWLIWQFSENVRDTWSPTVRPPRLGGNERIGVFASRSTFRPNALALSSVKLTRVEMDKTLGPVLYVTGADLMNGTPIYDIKPYLPYADIHEDAVGGFTGDGSIRRLQVVFEVDAANYLSEQKIAGLYEVLSLDPRPAYQKDPNRIYGFPFAGCEVKFKVDENDIVRVIDMMTIER